MNRFNSILLPLDGSAEAAKGAGCAIWLADALGATLHVLHATEQPVPGREALERLRVRSGERAQVVVHQLTGNAATAIVEAIAAYDIGLLVMSACGESASAGSAQHGGLGTVAKSVIEHCPVPVLLLPVHYREVLPWTSMLAAASGEAAADQALEAAAQLAAALHLKVTVVHSENGPLATYADTVHHEYPRRIEEMAKRGLAGCDTAECECIDRILLRRGDPAAVLLAQAALQASSVLAIGWHGAFEAGRAIVFKRLLAQTECALLLVCGAEVSGTRLLVGKEIDD